MIVREIDREELEKDPFLVWNSFIQIIGISTYESLSPIQRLPHLVFMYESEVQNGGHFEYFTNRFDSDEKIPKTILALKEMGAISQSQILTDAFYFFSLQKRERDLTVEGFYKNSPEIEFDEHDSRFADAKPSLIEILERYLKENEESFIKVISDRRER